MPVVRACRNRWCPEHAGPDGWCDAHRKLPFAGSAPLPPDWPQIRARQLAAFPLCAECGARATDVHHVRGREAGHGPGNLRSLCGTCHRRRTGIEAGWLGRP
jgi:5-methylcytosine-specific restriction endonuclease McrA